MSGYRFHPGYTRVGGVMQDFTPRVIERINRLMASLPAAMRDVEKLVMRNKIFVDRLRGVGAMTKEQAIDLCVTGPLARASGITYDLRKDEPYLAYPELDFEVPYATEGDCYARFQVRFEEILQSLKMIRQATANLPDGPVNVPIADKYPLPDKATAYNSMEGLIQHFELIMPNRGPETPVDEVYSAVESPNGELGYYLVADGTQVAWRVRTRPPSFIHFSAFPHLIQGHMIADVVAVLGSLNVIAAELDR
jgi:NADH-quinone oxidoreductase subunit D